MKMTLNYSLYDSYFVCSTKVEQGSSTGISIKKLVVRTVKRQPSARWSAMVLSLVYQQLIDPPLEAPTTQQHRVWCSDWFLPLQTMYWIAGSLSGHLAKWILNKKKFTLKMCLSAATLISWIWVLAGLILRLDTIQLDWQGSQSIIQK